MKIKVDRAYKQYSYTIGKLYIDGKFFCNTLEDKDRGLTQSTPLEEIAKIKIPSQTAIPAGIYRVILSQVSPRFSKSDKYKSIGGKLPRLLDVPGSDGVLIHIGNTEKDTAGCILVGKNKVKGQVVNSTETFFKLYPILKEASDRGEIITIDIK